MNKAQARERFAAVENKYRDELARKDGYIKQLEQQLREALAGKVPDEVIATAGTIYMEAIISARTKQGMVNLRWGFMSAQLTVQKLKAVSKAVVHHWREFGPEFGFDEIVEAAATVIETPSDQERKQ